MDVARMQRLSESIPASYTIWKDGTTYRAECNIKGGTDYSGTDVKTVIEAAINALPARTWKEKIILKGDLGDVSNVTLESNLILAGNECKLNLPLTASVMFTTSVDLANIDFKNIYFTASYGTRGAVECNAIRAFDGANYKTLENCTFSNLYFDEYIHDSSLAGRGIHAILAHSKIQNSVFKSTNHSAYGTTQIFLRNGSHDVGIVNNDFFADILGNTIYGQVTNNIRIIGNYFEQTANFDALSNDSVEFRGSTDININSNNFQSLAKGAIYIVGDNTSGRNDRVNIANNTFEYCGNLALDSTSAIRIYTSANSNRQVKILGNSFSRCWNGITVGMQANAGEHDVDIIGNSFTDCLHDLAIWQQLNKVRVRNNYFTNVAYSATNYYIHYIAPDVILQNNIGFNPVGVLLFPFCNNSAGLGYYFGWVEVNAGPTAANQDYTCISYDCILDITGGTGVDVTLKDAAGNTVWSPGATPIHGLYVPRGWKVNFGNFSVAPTVVCAGI